MPNYSLPVTTTAQHRLQITAHEIGIDGNPLEEAFNNVVYIKCRLLETLFGYFWNTQTEQHFDTQTPSQQPVLNDNFDLYNVTSQLAMASYRFKSIYLFSPSPGTVAFNGMPADRLLALIFLDGTRREHVLQIPVVNSTGPDIGAGLIFYGVGKAISRPIDDNVRAFYTLSMENEFLPFEP